METKNDNISSACVHCGRCTQGCAFLHKYKLDLAGFESRPELAYSCYMCGDCKRACPLSIDGHQIALKLRKEAVKQNTRKLLDQQYRALILEKENYVFKNYSALNSLKKDCKTVFFPGCNVVSFLPKTVKLLMQILHAKAEIATVFDCCGKPIYELGLASETEQILTRIQQQLQENSVEELVTACPNCYYFLKPLLGIPVVSIFEKLLELDIGKKLDVAKVNMYQPCPDRDSQEFMLQLKAFITGEIELVKGVQCCGLGGSAAVKEPDLSKVFIYELNNNKAEAMLTYCASCAGQIKRSGYNQIEHLLPLILGVDEQIPMGMASVFNRARFKFQ